MDSVRSTLLSTRALVVGAVFIVLFGLTVQPIRDPDFFWHVRVGDWILAHHAIPRVDLFTYTVPGKPWIAHEWLSEALMAALFRGPGMGAVALVFGIVTWLGLVCLYRSADGVAYPIRVAALLLGVAAANPILGPRTQMITFTLTALVILLLRRHAQTMSSRWLRPLPLIFLVWANTHAGFVFGLGVVGLYALLALVGRGGAASAKPLLLALGASIVVCAINPNGPLVIEYPLQNMLNPAIQGLVDEWKSPDFHSSILRPYEALVLVVGLTFALVPRGPRPVDAILLLLTLDLSLHGVRNIVLFVAVATPVVAESGQVLWETWRDRLPRLNEPQARGPALVINAAVLVLVAFLSLASLVPALGQSPGGRVVRQSFPVAMVDRVVADTPPGHVFNAFQWGGYLAFRMPQQRVYIYGEAELVGRPLLEEYAAVATIRHDYLALLDARGISWVIYPRGQPLVVALEHSADWVKVDEDGQATLLVRRGAATADYLARHGQA